jgi:GrpB protein
MGTTAGPRWVRARLSRASARPSSRWPASASSSSGTGARRHRGQPCGPAATRRPPGDRPHRPPHGVGGINGQPTSFLPAVIQRLRTLGYLHEGDLGVPGREAFTTPAGAPPHHLYVCATGTPALDRHLAFRDGLRADPSPAGANGDLKRTLAAQLGSNRAGYTEAKSAFIEQALAASPPRP